MEILYLRIRAIGAMVALLFFFTQISFSQNDNCTGALPLNVNTSGACTASTNSTTVGATQSIAGCVGNADDDIWFTLVPTSTSHYITVTGLTLYDPVLEMFAGSCGSLTSIGCVDGTIGTPEVAIATSLTIGATYYIRVYSYFGAGDQGTLNICVTTPDNPAPYCASNAFDSSLYINNFSTTTALSNITNPSGYTAGGYANYTAQSVVALSNSTFNFASAFTGGTFGFNIWVDWNNNNAFSAAEKMYASGTYVSSASGTITIPNGTAAGNYRMRIRAHWLDTNPPACGDNLDGGETEDYVLTVQPLLCATVPTSLTSNSITATSANFNWTAPTPAPASGYTYYYSTSSTPPTFASTGNGNTGAGVITTPLSGLSAGTTYYAWVRSNCGGGNGMGNWVGPISFTTLMQVTGVDICPGASGSLTATSACGGFTSSMTINGSWAINPQANRITTGMSNSATCGFGATTSTYSTYNFQVSATGTYVFTMANNPNYDGMAYIVSGAFTPGSCATGNWIVGDDDSGTGLEPILTTTLTAGTTYTLISTIFSFSNITITDNFQYSVTGPGSILTGATGVIQWYVASTGGSSIFTGNSFNPVGAAGSGIVNNTTPITKTFYAACSLTPTIRTPVVFNIKSPATAVITRVGNICSGAQINIVLTGTPPWDITYTNNIGDPPVTLTNVPTSPLVVDVFPNGPVIYTVTAVSNATCPVGTFSGTANFAANKWLGVTSAWSNPANWSSGTVPTASDCVVIPPATNFATIDNTELGLANRLLVKGGGRLDILNERAITVTNTVNVEPTGIFNIENGSSLLQTSATAANVGNVNVKRNINVRKYDYTYWNSPMRPGFGPLLTSFSPQSPTDKFYSWTPTISNGNGIWKQEDPLTIEMTSKKGFIIRAPSLTPVNLPFLYTMTFTGTPNNGAFTAPIKAGTAVGDDDSWNLIGNPYPSAISVASFFANSFNTTNLDNTVYLWTHNSMPLTSNGQPFYGTFYSNYSGSDYASCTGSLGCIAACVTCPTPNGFIASGQSFFIKSKVASNNARFDNGMRVALNNSQFFRSTGESFPIEDAISPETNKQLLWLNMSNNIDKFNQILVGYANGATNGYDNGFDGTRFTSSSMSFYSVIEGNNLAIQGRPTPFDVNDQVPLGFTVTNSENFFIGIDHFDAQFSNINIYLEDLVLGVIHDLKTSPYSFTAVAGATNDRFILRYTAENLDVNNSDMLNVTAFINSSKLNIRADQNISEVQIFDISGKRITTFVPTNAEQTQIWDFNYAQGAYLAKIKLESGVTATRKLLN